MDKIQYVNGFLFSPDLKRIILIRKNRPQFQVGLLNGVGGKIKLNEEPINAMQREFEEEAGLEIKNWNYFLKLIGDTWEVYFYYAIAENYKLASSKTDEEIEIHYTFNLSQLEVIPNLKWIIPMAMDSNHKTCIAYSN